MKFPDDAAMQFGHCVAHQSPTATLVPHLNQSLVFAGGGHHPLGLLRVVAAGFFNIDMLARVAGEDGRGCMPMIGSGDADGIQRSVVEHPSEIDHFLGATPCFFLDPVRGFGGGPAIDIADGSNHATGHGEKPFQMRFASMEPHHAYGDLVSGLGGSDGAGEQCGSGSPSGGLQKMSPGQGRGTHAAIGFLPGTDVEIRFEAFGLESGFGLRVPSCSVEIAARETNSLDEP